MATDAAEPTNTKRTQVRAKLEDVRRAEAERDNAELLYQEAIGDCERLRVRLGDAEATGRQLEAANAAYTGLVTASVKLRATMAERENQAAEWERQVWVLRVRDYRLHADRLLLLDALRELRANHPLLAKMEPDVEWPTEEVDNDVECPGQ